MGNIDLICMWIAELVPLSATLFSFIYGLRNFFKKGKYIEKFQRRIDFMNLNYKRVLKSFGFYDVSNYKILYFMVFNKVIVSRYRNINIPLISITELEEKIKNS